MAEQIISPGVFQNENAPVVLAAAAAPLGAAIVGPTVKGQIGIPTVVSTYSEYLQKFGGSFVSGGFEQTYFTALSAQNYFRQGGTSLTVVRVASGSANFTAGDSTTIANDRPSALAATISIASITTNVTGGTADTYTAVDIVGGTGTGGVVTVILDSATNISSIAVTTAGTGYVIGDTVTIAAANLGASSTEVGLTLVADDLLSSSSFSLKTISQGANQNSFSTMAAGQALPSGSSANIRFEVSNVNTSSGIFDLFVRQGNDRMADKTILESWRGVSLDATRDDFISKVIGNQQFTVGAEGSDSFVNITGEYPNKSNYIIVSGIASPTPNYLNGAGNPEPALTGSLPIAQSGSFNNATGSLIFNGGAGVTNMYDKITNTNSQGLIASDYTSSINLLKNKDQYAFNVISTPGLIYEFATHKTVLDSLVTNTTTRGDSILPIDVSAYGATVASTVSQASSLNTNYAAAYWPWLLVNDQNTGANVWAPASTVIPSVYVYNDTQSRAWFAPAGFTRGTMPGVVTPEKTLPRGLRDTLYTGKVNPIATFPGTGVVVYGQKTLQNLSTALDRVNVRRLLITLKDFIGNLSQTLVFEPNSLQTRNSFLSTVNPYLEGVQQNQGLYAFKVVMDDSNNGPDVIDRNELRGAIYLQPVKTAEFIVLDFNLLPTGAEFPA